MPLPSFIKRVFHRSSKSTSNPSETANPTEAEPRRENGLTPEQGAALAHWAVYGNYNDRAEPPKERATSSSWKVNPFKKPKTADWVVPLRKEDIHRLVMGFIPEAMEDKWFIYSEDITSTNDSGEERISGLRVGFFRSWTGLRVAEIEVELGETLDLDGLAEGMIVRITYESSSKEMTRPSLETAQAAVREVCSWILQVQLPE